MRDDLINLDIQNAASLARCEERSLTPKVEDGDECAECGGTGYVKGTESENIWGLPCTEGCPHNPYKSMGMAFDGTDIEMRRAS